MSYLLHPSARRLPADGERGLKYASLAELRVLSAGPGESRLSFEVMRTRLGRIESGDILILWRERRDLADAALKAQADARAKRPTNIGGGLHRCPRRR